ncbi:hypothetical protein Tsubulata_044431, partial [Turnera subulata]
MEDGTREIRNNTTLICVPIVADSVDDMLVAMARAKSSGADLVEIRLDSLNRFTPREDLKTLVKSSPLPTLFTYRPKWEGGQYDGDDHHRLDVLRLAVEFGADYVDVELQVACRFIDSVRGWKPANCRVIVSSRNYQNTPSVEELGNLVAMMQATGADIVKIATTASDITDVARIFRITVHSQVMNYISAPCNNNISCCRIIRFINAECYEKLLARWSFCMEWTIRVFLSY